MEEIQEKKCALCGAVLEGAGKNVSGEFHCRRCGAAGRYEGENLVAMDIPDYDARMAELASRNRELLREIDLEGIKGEHRDMRYLQRKHLERQDVLCEYAFLSHFMDFVRKW